MKFLRNMLAFLPVFRLTLGDSSGGNGTERDELLFSVTNQNLLAVVVAV